MLEELEPSSSWAKHSSGYVILPPHEAIVLCDEEVKKTAVLIDEAEYNIPGMAQPLPTTFTTALNHVYAALSS